MDCESIRWSSTTVHSHWVEGGCNSSSAGLIELIQNQQQTMMRLFVSLLHMHLYYVSPSKIDAWPRYLKAPLDPHAVIVSGEETAARPHCLADGSMRRWSEQSQTVRANGFLFENILD